ncbi:hypothetical protein [Paucibacter sp. KCTC 42545]|uniref:hypothetical protein n=1 Tax=Paucibacter sp. KCTC 42545 TaxID=1768242 RepID=UPI000733A7CF|nr:hypothetical protein [Paucibacter sp. KCTC 42545]ALT76852.1 hypothetical protein AT984_06255 [Paucibacter sp. KCTC 42545]
MTRSLSSIARLAPWSRQTDAPLGELAAHFASTPSPADTTDPSALSFDALRQQAIAHAQAASGELWTDYNLHDPGVSLLEVMCYALTEDIYNAERSVPELLGLDQAASAQDWQDYALHPAPAVLHCRPCSEDDYQRSLHEMLPGARQLNIRALRDAGGTGLGLWRLSLLGSAAAKPSGPGAAIPTAPDQAHAQARSLARAYWSQRNLGEDLQGMPQALRPRWLEIDLQIQVQGSRDLLDLLGEAMLRCDDLIAARPQRQAVNPSKGLRDPDDESGPPQSLGRIDDATLQQGRAPQLYLSDLARRLSALEGVAGLPRLSLRVDGATVTEAMLDWRGSDWALALRWPSSPADLQGWRVYRQGSASSAGSPGSDQSYLREENRVQLPVDALLRHLRDVQTARRPLQALQPLAAQIAGPSATPPSALRAQAHASYYPASQQLPYIYQQQGPGRLQWTGYLALLEQWLAQAKAQAEHLPQLYAISATTDKERSAKHGEHSHMSGAQPSYWWALLRDAELAGMDSLYLDSPEALEAQLSSAADDKHERQMRVLDHLLALHGEALDFSELQGLPCYFGPEAWAAHLLSRKQEMAAHVLRFTAGRHAAFDYSRRSIAQGTDSNTSSNTSVLQQRLSLQLAFAHSHSRPLCSALAPLEALGLDFHEAAAAALTLKLNRQRPTASSTRSHHGPQLRAQDLRLSQAPDWPALIQHIPALRGPQLPAVLRASVWPEHFEFASTDQGPVNLLLQLPDEQLTLAQASTLAAAQDLALQLHAAACQLQRDCEGLHLVEHVLLRPEQDAELDKLPPFFSHQISLVFPAWTARCADARFRALARQLAMQAAPAHLHCRLLWLSLAQMKQFERLYQTWLIAKIDHCQAALASSEDPARQATASVRLSQRAQALAEFLQTCEAAP